MASKGEFTKAYREISNKLSGELPTVDGELIKLHEDKARHIALAVTNMYFSRKDNKAKYYKRKENDNLFTNEFGQFLFLHYGELLQLDIKPQYLFRFVYISTFVCYEGEQLMSETRRKPMAYEELIRVLNMPNRMELSRTLTALKEYNLLYEKEGCFYINKRFAIRGKVTKGKNTGINETSRVFIDGIRKLYQEADRKDDKDIWYLFKMLPYINKHFNMLCVPEDVEETTHDEIRRLSTSEIAKIFQMGRKKTFETIMRLRVMDMPVMMAVLVGTDDINCTSYYVNPYIFYQGSAQNNQAIQFLLDNFREKVA